MQKNIYPFSFQTSQLFSGLLLFSFILVAVLQDFAAPIIVRLASIPMVFFATVTFVMAHYVVIRYPFLSLLPPNDIDISRRLFTTTIPFLYKFAGLVIVTVFLLAIMHQVSRGFDSISAVLMMVYLTWVIGFILFLVFFYSPELQPTTATFLSATLGFGILVSPLFVLALLAGRIHFEWLLRQSPDAPHNKAMKWSGKARPAREPR